MYLEASTVKPGRASLSGAEYQNRCALSLAPASFDIYRRSRAGVQLRGRRFARRREPVVDGLRNGENSMMINNLPPKYFPPTDTPKYNFGDYDAERAKFYPNAHGKFNFGAAQPSGLHAPSATPDGKGGVICIWNMNPGLPKKGWGQLMSLPRRLTLIGDNELGIDPTGDIASLRGTHKSLGRQPIPANCETVLDGIEGNAIELKLEIDAGGAPMVELNVLRSPDRQEHTRIVFYRERGFKLPVRRPDSRDSLISIDSSRSSILPDALCRAPETAPVVLGPEETLKLHVFIDRSVIEVFVNGRQCVAMRVYPGRTAPASL